MLRELQQMKADGIGGAEMAFVYAEELDDPAKGIKNLPFLSPEMLDVVTYAQAEGRRLGLANRCDVVLGLAIRRAGHNAGAGGNAGAHGRGARCGKCDLSGRATFAGG